MSLLLKKLDPRRRLLGTSCSLLEQLERALLRLVARLHKVLKSALARRVLLARYDAPLLRLNEVLARQATARVLGRAMVDLGLCANRGHLATRGLA